MATKALRGIALSILGLFVALQVHAQEESTKTTALWLDGGGTSLSHSVIINETVADAQMVGAETLIALVRSEGDAHWRSRLEPRSNAIHGALSDPLATLIERARHPEGGDPLTVWPAINTLLIHRGATLPPLGHIKHIHPDWLLPTADGRAEVREGGVLHTFVDPALPEVRDHTAAVVRELVSNYDMPVLVLDTLRLPIAEEPLGSSPLAVQEWQRLTRSYGMPDAEDAQAKNWRRQAITDLLRELRDTAKEANPDIEVWVAVEAVGDLGRGFQQTPVYQQMLQDWPSWIEEGLCDGVILKNHQNLHSTDGPVQFDSWLAFAEDVVGDLPLILSFDGTHNYQNLLFDRIATYYHGDNNLSGVALWHHSDPARDADARFYTNFQRARQSVVPHISTSIDQAAYPMASTADLASIEIPTFDGTLDEALGVDPSMEIETPVDPEPVAATVIEAVTEPVVEFEVAAEFMPEEIPEVEPIDVAETLPPPADPDTIVPIDMSNSSIAVSGGVFDDLDPVVIPSPTIGTLLSPSTQDIIVLQSGQRIEGDIVDERADRISVTLADGSEMDLPRSRIASIDHAAD